MKLLIGVPTAEFARRADFYDHFNLLRKPNGTALAFSHGQSPARNRNELIGQALEHDCTHIFFLDDDIILQPDALEKLMRHDVDAVTGIYLMRNYPHQPIIFDNASNDGRCSHHFVKDGETGLIPIVNAGLGCALIKIDVFKKMEKPWVRLGELEKDHWCDDIGFFNRFRDAGFKLFCDLEVTGGHIASVVIRPEYTDGKWYCSYDTNGPNRVIMPIVQGI